MKIKQNFVPFCAGMVSAVMLTTCVTGAVAATAGISKWNAININVNGETVLEADKNLTTDYGTSIPSSILYVDETGGGTTYIPVRVFTEMMDLSTAWDGEQNVLEIALPTETLKESSSTPESGSDDEPKKTAQGLVYGNLVDNCVSDLDLIAALGVDGTRGYVLRTDLEPELYTQEAREARMAALKENNLIPLYDLNGNQIGQFAIGVEDDDDDISEDIQARIDQLQQNVPVSAASEAASSQEGQGESLGSAISEEVYSRMVNGTYPTTANGETYGTLLDCYVIGYHPDLIAVVGNAGHRGYVYYREFSRASAGTLINVYDLNGNVIDSYGQG
jgi:hypothetical protein